MNATQTQLTSFNNKLQKKNGGEEQTRSCSRYTRLISLLVLDKSIIRCLVCRFVSCANQHLFSLFKISFHLKNVLGSFACCSTYHSSVGSLKSRDIRTSTEMFAYVTYNSSLSVGQVGPTAVERNAVAARFFSVLITDSSSHKYAVKGTRSTSLALAFFVYRCSVGIYLDGKATRNNWSTSSTRHCNSSQHFTSFRPLCRQVYIVVKVEVHDLIKS